MTLTGMNSQMLKINVLNQAAVAQSSFRAVAVPQDQRQCSKHFGPRISISLLQLTHPSAISLPLLKKHQNSVWETASSTGAGNSINANAYHRCSMAITRVSRRHNYKTWKTMLSFQHPTPNFKTIKGEKKVSKHVASAGSTGPPR